MDLCFGRENLQHRVWCSIAIGKSNVNMFWLSKTCCMLSYMRVMNPYSTISETLVHKVFWAIMVWLNNASMFWMSKTWNFVLGQEILTHSVWCSIAIGKNTVKMFWLSKTCNLLSSLRGKYHHPKTKYTIFHNVYWAILVITNNTSMFWMSKTWIFVLVEQFYYLVCDAA